MTKPSRSRKERFTSPIHIRSSLTVSSLSEDLRKKHGTRNLRVRKGDSVKVLRGEYKGIEGKVTAVYPELGRVSIEGVTREKIAGGTVPVKIHASKVTITSLNLDDKWRSNKLEELAQRGKEAVTT